MASTGFRPESLPEVDVVEIVDLAGLRPNRVSEHMVAAVHAPRVCVSGEEALALASLWRRLPEGEQMRCHVPRYGLRFFAGEQLVAEASVCFDCNNIFGSTAAGPFHFSFDADAPESVELLAAVREQALKRSDERALR